MTDCNEIEDGDCTVEPGRFANKRTRIKYKCNRGYELRGVTQLKCSSGGVWYPSTPPHCSSK